MGRREKKRPQAKAEPQPSKRPRALAPGDWDGSEPRFSFAKADLDGPLECQDCEPHHLDLLLRKLRDIEGMTWNELHRPGSHTPATFIRVEQISSALQSRLRQISMDDVEGLEELHLGGRERVWGIRTEGWFEFLWWDPDHTVYPSPKKHT